MLDDVDHAGIEPRVMLAALLALLLRLVLRNPRPPDIPLRLRRGRTVLAPPGGLLVGRPDRFVTALGGDLPC